MVVVVRRRSDVESSDRVTHRLAKRDSGTRNRRRPSEFAGKWCFQRCRADRLNWTGKALPFHIPVNSCHVKMISMQGTTGVTDLESGVFSFPRQTIVTGGQPEMKVAIHFRDRRLEDPRILA